MTPPLLTDDEIAAALAGLPGWQRDGGCLCRQYSFADFRAAFAFMGQVAVLAEALDHHPDWCNSWNRLDIRLSTHEAGGITARDVRLAGAINALDQ